LWTEARQILSTPAAQAQASIGKGMRIVRPRRRENATCFYCVIHRVDSNGVRRVAGERLICEEVVPQAVDDRTRQLRDVDDLAVSRIAEQYGQDLVVGLPPLDH